MISSDSLMQKGSLQPGLGKVQSGLGRAEWLREGLEAAGVEREMERKKDLLTSATGDGSS